MKKNPYQHILLACRVMAMAMAIAITTNSTLLATENSAKAILAHTSGYAADAEPVSSLIFAFILPVSAKFSLNLSQSFHKLYVKTIDNNELTYSDSTMTLAYRPDLQILDHTTNYTLTTILPISQKSRDNKIISLLNGTAAVNKKYLDSDLSVTYLTVLTYIFNKYTTTPHPASTPLARYSWMVGGNASYLIHKNLSLAITLGYTELTYEQVGRENSISPQKIDTTPAGSYVFSANLSTNFWGYDFTVGHHHADALAINGYSEFYVFDKYTSSYSISVGKKLF